MEKCRILIDASTLVSGMVFKGNEHELLLHGKSKNTELLTPEDAIDEVKKTLTTKFPEEVKLVDTFLDLTGIKVIERIAYLDYIHKYEFLRDTKDRYLLAAAVNAKCDYIVPGDSDLLVIKRYRGIEIVTTRKILDLISACI